MGSWLDVVAVGGHDAGVTLMQRWVVAGSGFVAAVGLGVVAWVYGRDGVEVVSWLAGIGSFVLAAVGLVVVAVPGGGGVGRVLRFSARARDNAQVIQAGGNVTGSGNRRQP